MFYAVIVRRVGDLASGLCHQGGGPGEPAQGRPGLRAGAQPPLRHRPGVRGAGPLLGQKDAGDGQGRADARQPLLHLVLPVRWGCSACTRGRGDTTAVDDAIEKVRAGQGLLIFPEGTRSKTGEPGKLKSGAFVVASAAGVDMIPCRIIYRHGHMRLFSRVRVCFGSPSPPSAVSGRAQERRQAAGEQAAAAGRLAGAL